MKMPGREAYEEVTIKVLINKQNLKTFEETGRKELDGKIMLMLHDCPDHHTTLALLVPVESTGLSSSCFQKLALPMLDVLHMEELKKMFDDTLNKFGEVKLN